MDPVCSPFFVLAGNFQTEFCVIARFCILLDLSQRSKMELIVYLFTQSRACIELLPNV